MKVYSVTQLREELNELMGQVTVAVQGEVSEFHVSQNRFVWFSLVDEQTTVKCFMLTFQLKTDLEDGMEIRAVGSPTLFRKGQFVFRPRQIELVGEGSLRKEYELLKKQLEKEGLFDEGRKRSLPRFPQRIGLVTSRDAAAYTDVLRILNNRWAGLDIRHVHVNVQGAQAENSITGALAQLNEEEPDLDAIILTRGGGSLEDLHAFNGEAVVRAVFGSRIPVVAGVGHERDTTLTDLAADVRASTPSNAAERVVPEKKDVLSELGHMLQQAESTVQRRVQERAHGVDQAVRVLEDHARSFVNRADSLQQRLLSAGSNLQNTVRFYRDRVDQMEQLMGSLNPTAILERGYAIARDSSGNTVSSKKQTNAGDDLHIQVSDGIIDATVKK